MLGCLWLFVILDSLCYYLSNSFGYIIKSYVYTCIGRIEKFNGKILNIHPSLLPKYKGLNTHVRALNKKDKFSGCTVHLVNSKLDSGKIILQKKVKIYKNDSVETLSKRILKQEHKLYPAAIKKLFG